MLEDSCHVTVQDKKAESSTTPRKFDIDVGDPAPHHSVKDAQRCGIHR